MFHRSDESTKHPLNIILKLLFRMFQARYIVDYYHRDLKKWEAKQKEAEKKKEEDKRPRALSAAQLVGSNGFDEDSDDDVDMSAEPESPIHLPPIDDESDEPGDSDDPEEAGEQDKSNQPPEAPSKKTLTLMKKCRFHAYFRNCLKNWDQIYKSDEIDEYKWDLNDRLGVDRLKHYVQSERKLVTNDPVERPTKSARTDHEMPKALKLARDGRTA